MGLVTTAVVPRLSYRVSSNLYCPHAQIVVDLSNRRLVFQANIHQLQCQSTCELFHNVLLCQELMRSQCRKQLSLSESRDQVLHKFS